MTDFLLWKAFWNLTVRGSPSGRSTRSIALGYTLVYGVLRLINFAHSEVFMIGTMGALSLPSGWASSSSARRRTRTRPASRARGLIAARACCSVGHGVRGRAAAVRLERHRLPARLRRARRTRPTSAVASISADRRVASPSLEFVRNWLRRNGRRPRDVADRAAILEKQDPLPLLRRRRPRRLRPRHRARHRDDDRLDHVREPHPHRPRHPCGRARCRDGSRSWASTSTR